MSYAIPKEVLKGEMITAPAINVVSHDTDGVLRPLASKIEVTKLARLDIRKK